MSIFKKVTILFIVSFIVMLIVAREINSITNEKIELILKEKYLQNSKELFKNLSSANYELLDKNLNEFGFIKLKEIEHYLKNSINIYEVNSTFGAIKILKHDDNRYFLYMKYLDDEILALDLSQESEFSKRSFLNFLVVIDISMLIVIFIILIKLLLPIKYIVKELKSFGDGNYSIRVKINANDEIGVLGQTFNLMAENLDNLIKARERLLRDISHELKTPISKGKLALEMIENSKYKLLLKKAFNELDMLSSEILSLEKLNVNQNLNFEKFGSERLILEALSKLFIEDEELIKIEISDNFLIYGDINYLSIALKNLIDNGLKYTTSYPIFIISKEQKIMLKSKGEKLTKPLEFYLKEFNREEHKTTKGYGLGLNIVKTILDKHNFKLTYEYENGFNSFEIFFLNCK